MRIPYRWLQEMLPDAPRPEQLEVILAGLGLEVERIIALPQPHSQVVFGRVLEAEEVPGTALRRLIVDVGQPIQLVSGAPNARAGMGLVVALPGSELPGGLVLGVRRIQGLESYGMGVSARELALGEYAGGLIELAPAALPVGTPLAEVWLPDQVLEVEITPNRPDWLSVLGVARDLAALGYTLHPPQPQPRTVALELPFTVEVEDTLGCDRFTLSYLRGIQIEASPPGVQQRLYAAGMRPISNVVDATNYAMLELGNPMHAFDLRDIGRGLVVRRARPGERLVTLDGVDRGLDPADLLITARVGGDTVPVGLAGVMGGENSEVKADTRQVALEVAHFDPVSIRRTARRQGLRSEASYRFERGVDPQGPVPAALRFAELLQQWGSGVELAQARIDLSYLSPIPTIAYRPTYAEKLVGVNYTLQEQQSALQGVGCRVEVAQPQWQVTPPSHRADLAIEEDLVEEVARIVGYDRIPETLPNFFAHPDNLAVGSDYAQLRRIKQVLAGLGFQEAMNYSWSSVEEAGLMRSPAPTVYMQNPQSPERTALRTALYPGLLRNLASSLNQNEAGPFLLFEEGKVFNQHEGQRLAGLLAGSWVDGGWQPGLAGGFFALKGLLETAARRLGARLEVEQAAQPYLHPGVSGAVRWNGQLVGYIGALHPAIARQLELEAPILFELDLPLPPSQPVFRDLPRVPAALRDLAVVVPSEVSFAQVAQLIRSQAGEFLEHLELFDLYQGPQLPQGRKSLAFHLVFRRPDRTLNDAEVEAFMVRLIGAVEAEGYALRR